jgi:23S rRNA pseudouridine1911/1915/1917 synthase
MSNTNAQASFDVLFEDNHLIAVSKKAGQIVQPDPDGTRALCDEVADWLAQKYNKPGKAFLGVAHRIDRPVSGVVLFAKTSKALIRLNELFRDRKVEKIYLALVEGKPKAEQMDLVHYLSRNQKTNKSYISDKQAEGRQLAKLSYKVIDYFDRYTLLEIQLGTGRHHQIRAQLSFSGLPIKGDVKYGARRSNDDRSICLHAYSLSFLHPVKNEPVKISCPLPDTSAWPKKKGAE